MKGPGGMYNGIHGMKTLRDRRGREIIEGNIILVEDLYAVVVEVIENCVIYRHFPGQGMNPRHPIAAVSDSREVEVVADLGGDTAPGLFGLPGHKRVEGPMQIEILRFLAETTLRVREWLDCSIGPEEARVVETTRHLDRAFGAFWRWIDEERRKQPVKNITQVRKSRKTSRR